MTAKPSSSHSLNYLQHEDSLFHHYLLTFYCISEYNTFLHQISKLVLSITIVISITIHSSEGLFLIAVICNKARETIDFEVNFIFKQRQTCKSAFYHCDKMPEMNNLKGEMVSLFLRKKAHDWLDLFTLELEVR